MAAAAGGGGSGAGLALQPLQDNAGAGFALIDTILQARLAHTGVVLPTWTRLLYVAKLSKSATPQEVYELHANFLADFDREATGLLVIQANSALNIIESSSETVTALLRHVQAEAARGDDARIVSVRVVAFTEDVPERTLSPWAYAAVSLPPEGTVVVDADATVTLSANLYRTVSQVCQQLKEAGPSGLEHLQERYAAYLPSDDRVAALATTDKVRPAAYAHVCMRARVWAAVRARSPTTPSPRHVCS